MVIFVILSCKRGTLQKLKHLGDIANRAVVLKLVDSKDSLLLQYAKLIFVRVSFFMCIFQSLKGKFQICY